MDHELNSHIDWENRKPGDGQERKVGFGLVMFSFDGPELTWISNAERSDMATALRELLARWDSGHRLEAAEKKARHELITSADITGADPIPQL